MQEHYGGRNTVILIVREHCVLAIRSIGIQRMLYRVLHVSWHCMKLLRILKIPNSLQEGFCLSFQGCTCCICTISQRELCLVAAAGRNLPAG